MEILTFTHPTLGDIRGMEIDGKPWLVGKDVAVALGYKNPQLAIRTHIEDKDKGVTKILTPGGRQNVPIINENGFYSLAFKSKLSNAKEIREWVITDVFAQLRPKPAVEETPVQCSLFDEDQCENGNNDGEKVAESNVPEVFQNPEFGQIRILTEGEKMLFCAKDVAVALGYKNPRDAINRHCRYVVKRDGVSFTTNQHGATSEQTVEMSFIPEGDVYRLIVRSDLPSAERFERWVFDEVLPSIRKNGGYIFNQERMTPEELMAAALIVAQKTIENQKARLQALDQQNQALNQQNQQLLPRAQCFDALMDTKNLTSFRDAAKELHTQQNTFIAFLLEKKYIFRKPNRQLSPYQRYVDKGWFETRDVINEKTGWSGTQTFITIKGKAALLRILAKQNT